MAEQTPADPAPIGPEAAGAVPQPDSRTGVLMGGSAYLIWGLLPLYFVALRPSGALEILGHRVVWSLLLCALLLAYQRDLRFFARVLRSRRDALLLTAAAVLIGVNWYTYVEAVAADKVAEAALGYFLNPVVTVALGVVVLRERLSRLQTIAVACGAAAAIYLAVSGGGLPVIALILAFTFGLYGLVKKQVGGRVGAIQSMAMETAILTPPALALLWWLAAHGESTFAQHGSGHALLLMAAGLITTVPLLLFAAAARRVRLVTIGLLQFAAPIMQLLVGVVLLGERMPPARWVGFAIVWIGLAFLIADSVRALRPRR